MTAIRLLLCMFAFASCAVSATEPYVPLEKRLTPEQLRETGLNTLSVEQLAKLNAIIAGQPAPQTTPVFAAPPAAAAAAVPESASKPTVGFFEDPIKSKLVGPVRSWGPGTVFTLENGQQWKVLKGEFTLRSTLESPAVQV
ncbi:hypothetical protein, partial [Arenimonas sp. GDDSR-1]|uniref:hypothetical protein n=1 Tax=Arenimonas sp. GDDSR-1 TaxID=2950125 RepID=UPI002626AC39